MGATAQDPRSGWSVEPGPDQPDARWTGILDEDRAAALLVRVWVEADSDQFRARLTAIDTSGAAGAGAEQQTIAVAASVSDAVNAVRGWLEDFLRLVDEPIDSE
jgi:hypothetical protein